MSRQQAEITAGRIVRVGSADHAGAPDDGSTDPDITLSPISPAGFKTSGFLIILKQPGTNAAVPSGDDSTFSVTIWIRDPVTKVWGAGLAAAIGYDQAFVTGDVDAADLYFQIGDVGTPGDIDVRISEQSGHTGAGLRRAFGTGASGGSGTVTPTGFGPSESRTRYAAVTANTYGIAANPTRAYFLIVNQSAANLFVSLGGDVDITPGSELASIVLPPGSFAGYEVLNWVGQVTFRFDADDADGYALATEGLYP